MLDILLFILKLIGTTVAGAIAIIILILAIYIIYLVIKNILKEEQKKWVEVDGKIKMGRCKK